MKSDVSQNSKPSTSQRKQAVSRHSFRQALKIVQAFRSDQMPTVGELMSLYQQTDSAPLRKAILTAADVSELLADNRNSLAWAVLTLAMAMHDDERGN